MPPDTKNLVSLTAQEHIGPDSSGDNIGAKRVALYYWDGSNWQRQGGVGIATTTGGTSSSKTISAATTNATSVKASAGKIYGIEAFNNSSTIYYLKMYNKASAPTVGSDTPTKTYLIPHNSNNGAGFIFTTEIGVDYSAGIAFAITSGIADADTGACAANAVVVNIDYK